MKKKMNKNSARNHPKSKHFEAKIIDKKLKLKEKNLLFKPKHDTVIVTIAKMLPHKIDHTQIHIVYIR